MRNYTTAFLIVDVSGLVKKGEFVIEMNGLSSQEQNICESERGNGIYNRSQPEELTLTSVG